MTGFAVVLLAVLVHMPNVPTGKSPQEDAGVFLYAARTILEGGLPYRDVWDHKPPLIYYVDALGLLFGGTSLLGVWALQVTAFVVGAVLSLRALTKAFGTWSAFFGTAAWLLAAPRMFLFDGAFANFPQAFLAPLQFCALATLVGERGARASAWRPLAIGALGGVAALFTPAGIALWLAIAVHRIAWYARDGTIRHAVGYVAALAIGAATPLALVVAGLAVGGLLAEAWDQVIVYNLNYSRSASHTARLDALLYGLRLLASSGVLFVMAAGLALAIGARAALRDQTTSRRLVELALIAMPLDLLFGASAGRRHEYYWLASLPTIGILAALVLHVFSVRVAPALARSAAISRERIVTATCLALLAILAVRPALLGARVLTSTEDGINAAASAFVASRTAPADAVVVWGSRAAVLLIADRESGTRFVYQYAPLWTDGYHSEANAEEFVRAIRERRPALILDASTDSPATPPLDARRIALHDTQDSLFVVRPYVARVAEVVEQLYERTETVPGIGWVVWRPRDR